jgi:RNA polymerase subunit RPABC4/transcription elongation factor Spt4
MDFESILSTIQPFVIMFAALFAAFLTATWISVVIWAFRDIRARSRDIFAQILGTLMVLIFFPLFPLPGLAIYLILRPRETLAEIYERSLEEEALLQGIEERLACPGCNRRIEEEFMICPTCHTRLKKACPACGRLLHLRWNICPYCGAVQTAVKAAPAPAPAMAVTVEGPAEAPRLGESRPSALAEPASSASAQVAEPEDDTYPYPSREGGVPESDDGEPADEMPEAYGQAEPFDEDEDETSASGWDRAGETDTLPFDFE